MYSPEVCQQARNSRDHRFDGLFFVAVKSTGIYCRPICPAPTAQEKNVVYFEHAYSAAVAGFRPCIRCRPDAAPGSYAWLGTQTTAVRAKKLIDEGILTQLSVKALADKLGITQRYLNQLFKKYYGTSPKQYGLYKQCDLAKQLLQQTKLSVSQIAFASGFNSLRRFNDAFSKLFLLSPSQFRKDRTHPDPPIRLFMAFRPPYNWHAFHQFLQSRIIEPVEWLTELSYGRTYNLDGYQGAFTAHFDELNHGFHVEIKIDNIKGLHLVIANIRRVLDLDADPEFINQHLSDHLPTSLSLESGLRLPGIWDVFEAGIRAILGQQVSVAAARNLLKSLVETKGERNQFGNMCFPLPCVLADCEFDFFKMPGSRKQALRSLSSHCVVSKDFGDVDNWLNIKGVGPWTVDYVKMRGQSNPDIYLAGDLGVKKAIARHDGVEHLDCAPFRSYLTFQLWHSLSAV